MPDSILTSIDPLERGSDNLRVVVETPRGSRIKFKFDKELGAFTISSVLPAGAVFPYDFGYVPRTLADDGDPLDVLLLLDAPAFPGCVVTARLIGVIEAEQTEDRKVERNDRLVAVALESADYRDVRSIKDISGHLLQELEHFFVSYCEMSGKKYRTLGCRGPKAAKQALKRAIKNGK